MTVADGTQAFLGAEWVTSTYVACLLYLCVMFLVFSLEDTTLYSLSRGILHHSTHKAETLTPVGDPAVLPATLSC